MSFYLVLIGFGFRNINRKAQGTGHKSVSTFKYFSCCMYLFTGKRTENVRQKPSGGRERFTKHQGSGKDSGSTGGNGPVTQSSCYRGDYTETLQ